MDNVLCIIGTICLVVAVFIAFYAETATEKDRDALNVYTVYKTVLALSLVSTVCFFLFVLCLYLGGHLF